MVKRIKWNEMMKHLDKEHTFRCQVGPTKTFQKEPRKWVGECEPNIAGDLLSFLAEYRMQKKKRPVTLHMD